MRSVYLIRHGHVDFSSKDFRTSPRGRQWDPPLDAHGREQAQQLAARLSTMEPPAAIYTSPFRRCVETIEPYLASSGIEAAEDEALGEVYIADWEGKSFEEIVSGDEELARRFREQEVLFVLAGGESGDDLRGRVVPCVEEILAKHSEGDVFVIAHGGVINAYVTSVLGFDHDMLFLPDNTSLNTVTAGGEKREIRFLNDVRHLTSPEMFR